MGIRTELEKQYMTNSNWMTKLKTNKTFIKGSKTKNIDKKNKTKIEIPKTDRVNL